MAEQRFVNALIIISEKKNRTQKMKEVCKIRNVISKLLVSNTPLSNIIIIYRLLPCGTTDLSGIYYFLCMSRKKKLDVLTIQ